MEYDKRNIANKIKMFKDVFFAFLDGFKIEEKPADLRNPIQKY